jgi:hypothetical protein
MSRIDVERSLRIAAVDHVAAVEESGTPTAERPKCYDSDQLVIEEEP